MHLASVTIACLVSRGRLRMAGEKRCWAWGQPFSWRSASSASSPAKGRWFKDWEMSVVVYMQFRSYLAPTTRLSLGGLCLNAGRLISDQLGSDRWHECWHAGKTLGAFQVFQINSRFLAIRAAIWHIMLSSCCKMPQTVLFICQLKVHQQRPPLVWGSCTASYLDMELGFFKQPVIWKHV